MPTCFIEPNGFGAMYQAMLYGFAECVRLGEAYEHTPLKQIQHATSTPRANQLIGFFAYPFATPKSKRIEYTPELYGRPIDELFTDAVLTIIRTEYGRHWRPNNPYSKVKYVAVHIRRGDVNTAQHPYRFIALDRYKIWIDQLHAVYPDHQIVIISEGSRDEFDFPDYVLFHLNGDPLESFNIMLEAPVLFPARSSFSFTAGILSQGLVHRDVYETPWHHTPSETWLTLPPSLA